MLLPATSADCTAAAAPWLDGSERSALPSGW
jgi:hypothetical protein